MAKLNGKMFLQQYIRNLNKLKKLLLMTIYSVYEEIWRVIMYLNEESLKKWRDEKVKSQTYNKLCD